ncbi:hypothetical protein [Mycobacterium neglectum]|uniref:hypothetical protein n=1 Tax=Mycobacterium neglectum TaxID=242737 RepID=UPI001FE9EF77|nr:hypothetical protein [Mycobacterium neglectum]
MDLNRWLAKYAARRAHVFIAEVPGNWVLRAAVQDLIAARAWRQAVSPADADVLAVCGTADDDLLDLIDRIWDQLPGPRARVDILDVSPASPELDRAVGVLIDVKRQRTDARDRVRSPEPIRHHDPGPQGHHMPDSGQGNGAGHQHVKLGGGPPHGSSHLQHPEESREPADHDAYEHHHHDAHGSHAEQDEHGGHDMGHSSHDHMDHGDMNMAPAGIALAQGGEDRDGLEMDELHLRLGPFLAYWPAGLVLRCALQGDVITAAQAQLMGAGHGEQPRSPLANSREAARQADHLVDLLVLAGWPRAAARARRLRERLLNDPVDDSAAQKQVAALATLVRRSRVLRWALRDLAPIAVDDIDQYGLPASLGGDTYDRLLTRLDVVQGLIRHEADTPRLHMPWSAIEHMLPTLVEGLDVATARLVIAGLGIATDHAKAEQR